MEFEASRILSAVGAVLLAVGSFISGLGSLGLYFYL
jgi:multisubunit Na+/H+ antiporter MnhG subunit